MILFAMGRPRSKHFQLPPRMHAKQRKNGVTFYYQPSTGSRTPIRLGGDLAEAKRKWAELEGLASAQTFGAISERYEREVIPTKAPGTQKGNQLEIEWLRKVFGSSPIEAIRPVDVRRYLDVRGRKAPVRAKREKALLSHIFNKAREWGYTDAPNPCAGIRGVSEPGRDRYVEDAEYAAVWAKAKSWCQDAMDLALLTAQRPSDVLKMQRADIKDACLWVRQNKTGAKIRIAVKGRLGEAIERALARPRHAVGLFLVQDENGQRIGYFRLAKEFQRARLEAGVNFQFRDLRAKAATDVDSLGHAQKLLAHASVSMTEHYRKNRAGEKVDPLE